MGADLHNALRRLCSNTSWKYAVFWKLKYRARMVLTWEDAYYDGYDHHGSLGGINANLENLLGSHSQTDQLGLAVAKMSYYVYSLGEGIVGQVAATGKHQWIFADNLFDNSFSCFELSDGWQIQFSAGIRTIAVVAVLPYGVMQLGSLDKVVEDMKLVDDIRGVFLSLDDSCFVHGLNSPFSMSTGVGTVYRQEGPELPLSGTDEVEKLSRLRFNASCLDDHKQMMMDLISNQFQRDNNFLKEQDRTTKCSASPPSYSSDKDNIKLRGFLSPSQKFGFDLGNPSVNLLDSSVGDMIATDGVTSYLDGMLNEQESSSVIIEKDLANQKENEGQTSNFDSHGTLMMFSAGYELHEALGPEFFRRYVLSDHEQMNTQAGNALELPEGISSSYMTFDTNSGSLLEAVVSSACHSGSDVISEKSTCKSVKSLLTTEIVPDPAIQSNFIINPAGYSINNSFMKEDIQECSNSTEVCGAISSRGFSTCISACSEQLDRRSEPAKNKKRARPGESCRPRPRDRQLIQDRIKELRELVPNGSKCSIDSLLERTIKHMLFLESITKHADKLNKCAESKVHQKGTFPQNYDHGSSWAVEVGGHLKVSSIVVENLNKNGQMLIEMLCEECSHFLEIAEAIRGLGLTILKGVTEMQGDKTWICFVVEGQNNRIMHRMDILWSLVQVLQPKTTDQ